MGHSLGLPGLEGARIASHLPRKEEFQHGTTFEGVARNMSLLTSDAKLFGIDLSSLGGQLREAWQQLERLPLLRRCMPSSPMQVHGVNVPSGAIALARGDRLRWEKRIQTNEGASTAYAAVLLSADKVLLRSLRLPSMPPKTLQGAVLLDVQTMSPFGEDQTLWAYVVRPGAQLSAAQQVDVAITSRSLVAEELQEHYANLPQGVIPEVWVNAAENPIMLGGFGEQRRLQLEAKQRRWLAAGLLGTLALAIGLAITPTAQLRLRAIDAGNQLAKLTRSTSEVVGKRQGLMAEAESVSELLARQQQQIDHVRVMAALTRVLPDDTAVQRVQIKGTKLSVQGLSDNTSEVVELLSREPGFREVRLPSAVTRASRSSKESFALEAVIDPAILGLHASEDAAKETPASDAPEGQNPPQEGA